MKIARLVPYLIGVVAMVGWGMLLIPLWRCIWAIMVPCLVIMTIIALVGTVVAGILLYIWLFFNEPPPVPRMVVVTISPDSCLRVQALAHGLDSLYLQITYR